MWITFSGLWIGTSFHLHPSVDWHVISPAPSSSFHLQLHPRRPITAGIPETVTRARGFNLKEK
jgi:hypothetical protein